MEVSSPSTAAYDRSEKLEHDQRVPTIEEIVLVSHDALDITVYRRAAERWDTVATTGEGVT